MLFPDSAIEILRQARWSPDAVRSYEALSGGFFWSDERLFDVAPICTKSGSWAFRDVLAYRASLVRGTNSDQSCDAWYQLLSECPDWPGFHPERCDPSSAQELDAHDKDALNDFDKLDRLMNIALNCNDSK